jgi:trans-2,3-dihydro-3-hydroxyanthranilate isomerase
MSDTGAEMQLGSREGPAAAGRFLLVDVFTETPLEGNQLAVFPAAGDYAPEQMQRLACELNFSESVFVLPARGRADARLRIFTPRRELPFAGHPVLGGAVVLGEALDRSCVRLETALGVIPVELERGGRGVVFGRMRQAIPEWSRFGRERELLAAVGVERSELPVEAYRNGPLHVYVALASEEAVARLAPDLGALSALGDIGVNCFAGAGRSWRTRMFAPGAGVFEDPATGSAAGPLAIHLARHGRISFGEEITVRQGAEMGRPSVLFARAEGSRERVERVEVGGCAVVVARGEFHVAPARDGALGVQILPSMS